MKKNIFIISSLSLVLALLISIIGFLPRIAKVDALNYGNIITDFVYENQGSGLDTASKIDGWLNSNFPSGCISGSYRAPDPLGWSSSQNKMLFGSNVTAGKVIYDAGHIYNIDPEVLLTTLQKEQSAVSGGAGCHPNTPDPASATTMTNKCGSGTRKCTLACTYSGGCLNIAMGYGCPSYCDVRYEGFSNQVIWAANTFRFAEVRSEGTLTGYAGHDPGDENLYYSGPMTKGYRQRVSGGPTNFYDGTYTPQDASTITISNGATASLYNYTPFESGNGHFYSIFTGWFGSTQRNDTLTPHPNGTLVSYAGTIFVVSGGQLLPIASPEIFGSYHYQWKNVKAASAGDASLPIGSRIAFAPGTLIRTNTGSVYVMEYDGSILKKRGITGSAFRALGYSWSEVMYLNPSDMPTDDYPGSLSVPVHPSGTLVQDKASGTTFLIDKGTIRPVPNGTVFGTYNYSWGSVKKATSGDMQLTVGSNLEIRAGTVLLSSGNVYIADIDNSGSLKRAIGPWECYNGQLGYTQSDWISIRSSLLPANDGSSIKCI